MGRGKGETREASFPPFASSHRPTRVVNVILVITTIATTTTTIIIIIIIIIITIIIIIIIHYRNTQWEPLRRREISADTRYEIHGKFYGSITGQIFNTQGRGDY